MILGGGEWERHHAAHTMREWLRMSGTRFPFDLVSCQNDDLALGVIEELEAARRQPGQAELARVQVTGCDGAPDVGQALVRKGRLAATVVLPRTAGPAVELMGRLLLRGERPREAGHLRADVVSAARGAAPRRLTRAPARPSRIG